MSAGDFQGTYDASKVIITVGGIIVSGFGDGDFVTVKYDEDRFSKKVGADGEVGRSKNPSKAGTIDITTSATSAANDELSLLFGLDQMNGSDDVVAVGVSDLSGRSGCFASKGWLKTTPDMKFGKQIADNTWSLDCADLTMFFGGNG